MSDGTGRDIRAVIWGTDEDLIAETLYTQAGMFAVQAALWRLLESWDIRPDVVIGHSAGEIAAVHAAGVLSLDDAAALISARALLMQDLPPGGAMTALDAVPAEVAPYLGDGAAIAAVNSPRSLVISGTTAGVAAVTARFTALGRRATPLRVTRAFHSPLIDPVLPALAAAAGNLTHHPPVIPVISALTGQPHAVFDAAYWARHARSPVLFADAVTAARAAGTTHYLENTPAPTLTTHIHATTDTPPAPGTGTGPPGTTAAAGTGTPAGTSTPAATASGTPGTSAAGVGGAGAPVITTALHPRHPEPAALLRAIATLHATGTPVTWTRHPGPAATRLATQLPTYPFQRDRYWVSTPPAGDANASVAGHHVADHALLAAVIHHPGTGAITLTGRVSTGTHPWLADHAIGDTVIFPGTAFIELALRAGDEVGCSHLVELTLQMPLILSADVPVNIHVTVAAPDEAGQRPVRIYATPPDAAPNDQWSLYADGILASGPMTAPAADLAPWPPADAKEIDVTEAYSIMREMGYAYGPAFQGLTSMWRNKNGIYADAILPEHASSDARTLHAPPRPARRDDARRHPRQRRTRGRRTCPAVRLERGHAIRHPGSQTSSDDHDPWPGHPQLARG